MSNAQRLTRILLHVFPERKEQIETGEWGKSGSPYAFSTLSQGRQKLVIENPETGDRFGVIGKTRNEVLAQMEAKVGLKGESK